MSVVTVDQNLLMGSFSLSPQRFDFENVSDQTGYAESVLFGHPRWRVSLTASNDLSLEQGGQWEKLSLKMKGKANHLALYDPVRRAPEGTARGTMTVYTTAAAGATSMTIDAGSGQAGKTLKIGDWLQIGSGLGTSQTVKVTDDVTLDINGRGTVNFEFYLRQEAVSSTPVYWDHPIIYYKMLSTPTWSYQTNSRLQNGFNFDLMEAWS